MSRDKKTDFDVVVIGGGHAGVEAALAVARMGKTAAIITMEKSKLALMSCNPAIGGVAKSHVVKEVDALGGLMAEAIDNTGIQFRRLNLSRGPAVWSTRVQADRRKYNQYVVDFVERQQNVAVIEGLAGELIVESGQIRGARLESGETIAAQAVIVATGTFLGGTIHIGEKKIESGRLGEKAATQLSRSFLSLGFEVGRLKTGTPPRLDGNTIDFSRCQVQPGEEPVPFFSYRTVPHHVEQTPCYLTKTTAGTKALISANFEKSPIFSGQIDSTGPRYCPSIEDKFYRFADKESHQLFLEPEGDGTNDIYPNGFSTSLPEEIQRQAIRTVIGLENAVITKPGYAVEYDYCPAYQIKSSLETRRIGGLFLAGQINGTSGYEEAAGQGLMAGINAVLHIENEAPFVLDRSEAYIGVMIDDLTTRSTTEPYRLFTSRAEYRLALREDNARDRLFGYARKYGLVPETEIDSFENMKADSERIIAQLEQVRIKIADIEPLVNRFKKVQDISLAGLIRQPNLTVEQALRIIRSIDGFDSNGSQPLERAAINIRYQGYIAKQQREIDKFKRQEKEAIPDGFDFQSITGLKKEAAEKLARFRPSSLGQAGRIEGVTPGDLAILSVFVKRHKAG